MENNEAKARIRIDQLLKESGWRLIDGDQGKANVGLEGNIRIPQNHVDEHGEDYEKTTNGKADYLLYDKYNKIIAVLEAKSEKKDPLDGKEQARKYAESQNCQFIILSNGISHFFWHLTEGQNPTSISSFPTQENLEKIQSPQQSTPLHTEFVDENYIALTQYPHLLEEPDFLNPEKKQEFVKNRQLKILRDYQLKAVHSLQESFEEGNKRFLFEMATGTGKTLVSSAVIKLFLRTNNAKRVLFLVDRLELETQAKTSFKEHLKTDFTTVTYEPKNENWRNAQIVISTVQRLLNRYNKDFTPFDFDFVISDEAHRYMSGKSRAVFEYFLGYKLGLTATPKDYLKNIDDKDLEKKNVKALEQREILDTYNTFGCGEGREPTFKYDLKTGVKEKHLINPFVIDARTDITTKLLDEQGYAVIKGNVDGSEEERFFGRDFEKKFFNDKTNIALCRHFLENALLDPISGDIGKSLIFCVSQNHAKKITRILNNLASEKWSDKYQSNFAVQITSNVPDAQVYAKNFSNNHLNGKSKFLEGYKTSKTRVCVTVSMMTTGYDCPDILNICFMRPLFSPISFIQMKGRGTRKNTFRYENKTKEKTKFKMFDYFAVCEYFEKEFPYDESIPLPSNSQSEIQDYLKQDSSNDIVILNKQDEIVTETKREVPNVEALIQDKNYHPQVYKKIGSDSDIKRAVEFEDEDEAILLMREKYENKPDLYLNLENIRKSESLDRKINWRELLHRCLGMVDKFETKDEALENLFSEYLITEKPDRSNYEIKRFFQNYVGNKIFRNIINSQEYGQLNTSSEVGSFLMDDLKKIEDRFPIIIKYIKTYVDMNQFDIT